MATLYLVSTPIGNLDDLTHRAVRVLGEVDRVLAEDTRRTGRLLKHIGVDRPLVSFHAHNEASRVAQVLAWLDAGEDLALVSDAGTPLLSDPGERLVATVVERDHGVIPVPGPSAVLAALVSSGLPAQPFAFLGFVPRKGKDRTATLERIAGSSETTVVFESPERLVTLLEALVERCGPEREVAVCRELTKLHENVFRGTLEAARGYYEAEGVRGEVTVVVSPTRTPSGTDAVDTGAALALARAALDEGMSPSRAAREVARRLDIPRNTAYGLVQEEQERRRS